MTFLVSGKVVEMAEVSNQSTGYCPEPESWPAVAAALAAAGLSGLDRFSPSCVIRRCVLCDQKNLVKDGLFECQVCGKELPATYNCQDVVG